MKALQIFALIVVSLLALPAMAQTPVVLSVAEYDRLKAEGSLPDNPVIANENHQSFSRPLNMMEGVPKDDRSVCDLWQDPTPCTLAMAPNDDGSTQFIPIPFSFNLYGTYYTGLWINNNGNVTFTGPYGTFTGAAFPNDLYVMIAPFWGDVDTREGNGEVSYCITDSRIVVTWYEVGYYSMMGDKLNTFQLILTDGLDPLLGEGNNVAFLYQDMQWTTGAASGGVNGFGGSPAVVGANLGDGVSYIQIGLFDQAGTNYDGPFLTNDGVDWLDYRQFVFSTEVPVANVPPLVSGNALCDTVTACAGESYTVELEFYSPEPDQITSISYDTGGITDVELIQNTTGVTAEITLIINTTDADEGPHLVEITGTDNGSPAATTTVSFVLNVIANPEIPPVIEGASSFCEGGVTNLSVTGDFDSILWSNGAQGPNVTISQPGEYTVTVTNGGICSITSDPFTVAVDPNPSTPVIVGNSFSCGGTPVVLSTTEEYTTYQWNNGDQTAEVTVGSGNYTVLVSNEFGCTSQSMPFNVVVADDPTAAFFADPASPQLIGTTVDFTSTSSANGGVIDSLVWIISGGINVVGGGTFLSQTFTTPGEYSITHIVVNTNGCADTLTTNYLIIPADIHIPNVFSPNGDGVNDSFHIENIQYFGNEIKIFDRWGIMVHEARNYQNNWRANGIPDGTYFYIIVMEDGKEHTGTVTILR